MPVAHSAYLLTDTESKEIEIVSADDYGNFYLHFMVKPEREKTMIADIEWDIFTMHVNTTGYGEETNKEIVRFLAQIMEVEERQLIVVAGKNDKLKKVMLIDFNGTEYQVVNRIAYGCEYLLDPKKDNPRKKKKRKKIHDEELSLRRK